MDGNKALVLNLSELMKKYEILVDNLYDSIYIEERNKSIKLMHKWNKIRKIIEYQESKIKK